MEAVGADAGGGPPFHAAPPSPEVEILDEGPGESLDALSDDDKPEGWNLAERERRASRAYHRTKTMIKHEAMAEGVRRAKLSDAFQRAAARYDKALADDFPNMR